MDQVHSRGAVLSENLHVQEHCVLLVEFRAQGDDVEIRGHDLLEVFENQRPREGFSADQAIQELRLVARAAVGAHFEKRLRFGTFVVAAGDHLLQLRDVVAVASGYEPPAHRPAEQRHRHHGQQRHSCSPAHPEFARIFVRVSCEIDVEPHMAKLVLRDPLSGN